MSHRCLSRDSEASAQASGRDRQILRLEDNLLVTASEFLSAFFADQQPWNCQCGEFQYQSTLRPTSPQLSYQVCSVRFSTSFYCSNTHGRQTILEEEAGASFCPDLEGNRPLDDLLPSLTHAPQVGTWLLPRHAMFTGKGYSAGKTSGKGPRETRATVLATPFTGRTPQGLSVCFDYNLAHGCACPGDCPRGAHVCIKCFGRHSLINCTSR